MPGMKTRRHHALLALLEEHVVESQEQLQGLLASRGFDVNQATLSRDLRALNVVKSPRADGGSRYRPGAVGTNRPADQALALANLRAFLKAMEPAGNILVCKTRVGCAQPLGLALDQLKLEGIAGTVAGDDTLLTVVREGYNARDIMATIWSMTSGESS